MGDTKLENGNSEEAPRRNSSVEMESIKRVSKLPVIESTINLATDIYSKVKESNQMVGSVLSTAEATLRTAAEKAQPVAVKLEGPLKKVDAVLCTSLDYVETNVPSIKLPPQEMYENTKNAVCNTVQCVTSMAGIGGKPALAANVGKECQAGEKCCLHGGKGGNAQKNQTGDEGSPTEGEEESACCSGCSHQEAPPVIETSLLDESVDDDRLYSMAPLDPMET